MMAALQDSSRGTQACINAASIVSGIIADLDTTIMFATAGTLSSDDGNDSFTQHRYVKITSALLYYRLKLRLDCMIDNTL